jgi:hypothetical protein
LKEKEELAKEIRLTREVGRILREGRVQETK